MLGLFGLSLHAANIPFWKKSKFRKIFLIFWGNYQNNNKTFPKISVSIFFVPLCKYLFIGLSASQNKKSNPKFNQINFLFFCLVGPNWPNWPKTHKVAYRRQTNNILLRHVVFLGDCPTMLKTFHHSKIKISKNSFLFFLENFPKKIKKFSKFQFQIFVLQFT